MEHAIFSDTLKEEIEQILYACYPLHPVSTFILPRLSERVAQNERTLFTFLSANGISTLPAFLDRYKDDYFKVLTPDSIYDYFEPLFKKEVYAGELHKVYLLTNVILDKLQEDTLESKIVKTISLIYILEQFEKLKPTKDEIVGIYSISYSVDEIELAISNLIEKEYVVYLKKSNHYLRLKQTSGIDIREKIKDTIVKLAGKASIKTILNTSNFDNYMYPSRYNDEKEMTRFFSFEFIEEDEVSMDTNWNIKSETTEGDGVLYGIIPNSDESIETLRETLLQSSIGYERFIFILPKKYVEIKEIVMEFWAVSRLRENAAEDKNLLEEYDVVYEDLKEMIGAFISTYTHPEEFRASYLYRGEERTIIRKAALTGLMSDICDEVYPQTPVINNEALNRNEITSAASNSRNKIVAGLLRNELEKNLGLTGFGQEVSIMRSTLIRTGILDECDEYPKINLHPRDELIANMMTAIIDFIFKAKTKGQVGFIELYRRLMSPEEHIGLRKGLIPIYVAATFHEYKQQLIIQDRSGQIPISADVLSQINIKPERFSLVYLDWNPEKEEFVSCLADLFREYIIEAEKSISSYDYVASAMRRWYMALPKYTKEAKKTAKGKKLDKCYVNMVRLLRQNMGSHELLFEKLPEAFDAGQSDVDLSTKIASAKAYYDNCLGALRKKLIQEVKNIFSLEKSKEEMKKLSLSTVVKDWCETLDENVFQQLFADGTEKCLEVFQTITEDEYTFISKLAKIATDLRLEDWDDNTEERFIENLNHYKATAEEYHDIGVAACEEKIKFDGTAGNTYQVVFVEEDGQSVVKRFDRIEYSNRGKLLYNAITENIESMGHSMSEQEMRQVLMEVLRKLC